MARFSSKEVQHLQELHARFSAGTFTETEVHAALVLLREHDRLGPVRELAHSIAHSERNSGQLFERVLANREVLNNFRQKPGLVVCGDVFSADEFAQSLNRAITKAGLPALDTATTELILLCGLSLIQGGTVRAGKPFGEFLLTMTHERFQLLAKTEFQYQAKPLSVLFPVLSVPNHWLPVCNPRATIESHGLIRVTVHDSQPAIGGLKPFEVHLERAPPISEKDLDLALSVDPRLGRVAGGLVFTPLIDTPMQMKFDGERLTIPGMPSYFKPGSDYVALLMRLRQLLSACVHDDAGAHWFLEGLDLAPDGFHCHWVGRGSATCTKPL